MGSPQNTLRCQAGHGGVAVGAVKLLGSGQVEDDQSAPGLNSKLEFAHNDSLP